MHYCFTALRFSEITRGSILGGFPTMYAQTSERENGEIRSQSQSNGEEVRRFFNLVLETLQLDFRRVF